MYEIRVRNMGLLTCLTLTVISLLSRSEKDLNPNLESKLMHVDVLEAVISNLSVIIYVMPSFTNPFEGPLRSSFGYFSWAVNGPFIGSLDLHISQGFLFVVESRWQELLPHL
jgi:hypothetical protein